MQVDAGRQVGRWIGVQVWMDADIVHKGSRDMNTFHTADAVESYLQQSVHARAPSAPPYAQTQGRCCTASCEEQGLIAGPRWPDH